MSSKRKYIPSLYILYFLIIININLAAYCYATEQFLSSAITAVFTGLSYIYAKKIRKEIGI